MIYFSFADWSANPVITTLDTIVAPIEEIQFPTVTVCQDESKAPDNWAFLETIMNSIAFKCYDPTNNKRKKVKNLPLCSTTKSIRKDFRFLLTSIVKTFHQALTYGGKNDTMFQDLFDKYQHSQLLNDVIENFNEGKISKDKLYELPIKYFTQNVNFSDVLLKDYSLEDGHKYKESNYGSLDWTIIALLNEMVISIPDKKDTLRSEKLKENRRSEFGHMIFNYLSSNDESRGGPGQCKYGCIEPNNLTSFHTATVFQLRAKLDRRVVDPCHVLSDKEKFLHLIFTNFSRVVGFNDSVLISLYDLPAMLANPGTTHESLTQTLLYSRCKNNDTKFILYEALDCQEEWDNYISETKNGIYFWININSNKRD